MSKEQTQKPNLPYSNYRQKPRVTIDDFDQREVEGMADVKLLYFRHAMARLIEKKAEARQWRNKDNAMLLDIIGEEIEMVAKNIKKFAFLRKKSRGEITKDNSFDFDLIRTAPIEMVMPNRPANMAPNRWFYASPFREETRPSLVWFINNNRWWDFGANEGGSVIDLYMRLNDCDISTACKELSEML